MTIWYTARNIFGPDYEDGTSWAKYKSLSNLEHLVELVTLDSLLGEPTFEPDFENEKTYEIGVTTESQFFTYCYTDLNYVIENVGQMKRFNLLAVALNPQVEVRNYFIKDFEFVGYDLIDKNNDISGITNCGGFDETFKPEELNQFGLIGKLKRANEIRENLAINNPLEFHADTNVWAIWRHLIIGRNKSENIG